MEKKFRPVFGEPRTDKVDLSHLLKEGTSMFDQVQRAKEEGQTKVDIPRNALPPVLQYLMKSCETRPDSEVETEAKRQWPELELSVPEAREKLTSLALGVALGVSKMRAEPGDTFPPLVNADLLFRATVIAAKNLRKQREAKKQAKEKLRAERKNKRAMRKKSRR